MKTPSNQPAFESARDKANFTASRIENLLGRLERVRRTGPCTYSACCPAHDDRGPSLSVRETDDGRILLHCYAGCDPHDVLAAIGLTFRDLHPDRAIHHRVAPERRPFPVTDCLRAISFEALVVCSAVVAIVDGKPFSDADRERMILATHRIQAAVTAAGVAS